MSRFINMEFDIAIFVHEEVDKELKDQIFESDKKYVALMSKMYDEYDKYEHITSMCFPLYCSKIHTTIFMILYLFHAYYNTFY